MSDHFQDFEQHSKLLLAHMPHLLTIELLDWPVQAPQKFQTGLGDVRDDHPPVASLAAAHHQPAPLQAIQQASDVWIAVDHALRNLAASTPPPARTPQDPQSIELRR